MASLGPTTLSGMGRPAVTDHDAFVAPATALSKKRGWSEHMGEELPELSERWETLTGNGKKLCAAGSGAGGSARAVPQLGWAELGLQTFEELWDSIGTPNATASASPSASASRAASRAERAPRSHGGGGRPRERDSESTERGGEARADRAASPRRRRVTFGAGRVQLIPTREENLATAEAAATFAGVSADWRSSTAGACGAQEGAADEARDVFFEWDSLHNGGGWAALNAGNPRLASPAGTSWEAPHALRWAERLPNVA